MVRFITLSVQNIMTSIHDELQKILAQEFVSC